MLVKTLAVFLPHPSRLVGEIVARIGGIIAPYCGTLPLYVSCQIFGFLCVAAAGATVMQSHRVPAKSNQEGLGSNLKVQRNVEGDGFKFNFICNLRHHCHHAILLSLKRFAADLRLQAALGSQPAEKTEELEKELASIAV